MPRRSFLPKVGAPTDAKRAGPHVLADLERASALVVELSEILAKLSQNSLGHLPPPALMDDMQLNNLISAADLATRLDVDRRTLRDWVNARRLPPPMQIGRKQFWKRNEIERWLEEQRA